MQDASAEFETAMETEEVTWLEPQLLVDWLDDGASALTAAPAFVMDQFTDRVSDSTWTHPPGRPDSDYFHFDGTDAEYTVHPDGYATHLHNAVGGKRRSLVLVSTSKMTVIGVWSLASLLTGTGESAFEVIAGDEGDGLTNQFGLRLAVNAADDTMDAVLLKIDDGVVSAIDTSLDYLTHQADHEYVLMLQVDEGVVRAKIWDRSTTIEPVDWLFDVEDTVANLGQHGGCRSEIASGVTNSTPVTVRWHELRVIDGSIDDMSDITGQITITHGIDDGLPDEVSFVRTLPTGQLSAKIIDGQGGLDATQYLSQFNERSPLFELDRDVAPVTVEHGAVTSEGPERLRLFTGRMVDLPIGTDDQGQLIAISDTRLKLSQLVQPPPFNRYGDLSATWPVSWAAYQCGIYAAPPPSAAGAWYAPLHGSLVPFLDFGMPTQCYYAVVFPRLFAGYFRDVGAGEMELLTYGDDPESAPAYIDGPYVAAPDLQFTSDLAVGIYIDFPSFADPADGSPPYLLSEAGPRGRFEFIVRGDDFDTTAPSGTDFTPATFILMFGQTNQAGEGSVSCGINMSRELRIEMSDGAAGLDVSAGSDFDLPTDGQWYKYGVAWDFVTETVYFYKQDPDGTEYTDSSTNSAIDVTRLPATDEPFTPAKVEPFNDNAFLVEGFLNPYIHSFLPCAELHITTGTPANPDNAPWKWQEEFSPGAIIRPSATRLRALAEPSEREAWEMIGSYARAEAAAMRIDENDRLLYLTPAYWAEEAQQTTVQVLSTAHNVADLTPQIDPSKIRNMVRVNYQEARFDSLHGPLYQSREVIAIPPGESTLVIPLDVLATSVDTSAATLPTSTQVDNGVSSFLSGGWHTFFTINSSPTGTGTYYSGPVDLSTDFVTIQVNDVFTASVVTVSVINRTGTTVYTANDNPEVPTINIGGIGMYLTDASVITSRQSSIDRRGIRGLAVDVSVHQRREDAQRLADRLLNMLAEPSPTIENVRLFGDPRRQPGDLIEFEDRHRTAISGSWRLLSVQHVINGADYYQDVRLGKALPVGEWQTSGSSRWGQVLWGREGV